MDLTIDQGTTSKLVQISIIDSSHTDGRGLTGLTNASSGLIAYYIKEGNASATAITLSGGTVGTWSSGGFKEIDATHMPGAYELGIPNAALASGNSVLIFLSGATNMTQTKIKIQLQIPSGLKKNTALAGFPFEMYSSATHQLATGLTITAKRIIDGGSVANCSNSAVEVSNGIYKIDFTATDLNGNTIAFIFTATGADDRVIVIPTHS